MKTIRFGIIGAGLMGREFATAAARWAHLLDLDVRPQMVALCNRSPGPFAWFKQNFPEITQYSHDYRELLANPEVDAVYIAVPHNLHQEMYCATIAAGKHLMGEKPFGIDLAANSAILACAAKHPQVLVRCASEFPYFPAVQKLCALIAGGEIGRVLEVNAGFLHSSDLDPNKAINWKRMVEFNGEYGCMGDLGMHVCHVPFRAGFVPRDVRAVLSDIITQRPDGKGGMARCSTWDNATLLCAAQGPGGQTFPMTLKTQRISPGQRNNWYLEVLGDKTSARWSSSHPDLLEVLRYDGKQQNWTQVQTGYEGAFKAITGPIFQFGFTDCIQQMWAAFLFELAHGKPQNPFAGCATPEETALSHRLFTAALRSQANGSVEKV